jgi:BirA family transcriptional regulator, biotin operon repressor / biotin---[acetyl-CoA-carboxylase] ligase
VAAGAAARRAQVVVSAPLLQRVYAALGAGGFHSGESLAAGEGVTRSAVWKAIEGLRELGVEIEAVTHRGYRLAHPAVALDAAAIRAALPANSLALLQQVEVAWSVGSTNAELLARPPPAPGRVEALLAEHQDAGRGRRGRSWLAPVGGSLCLSLGAWFQTLPRELPTLSLAIGVCALRALESLGAQGLALKWPNDLLVRGRKAGGILIEMRAEAQGPGHVVIGAGFNLRLPAALAERIAASGTQPTDLATAGLDVTDRNRIAAALVGAMVSGLDAFVRDGFAPFAAEWAAADALRDQPVRILGAVADEARDGVARGIDAQGNLLVERADGHREVVNSGEVSVRPMVPA